MSTKISEMKLQAKEQHEVAFIVFAFHSTYLNSKYKSGLEKTSSSTVEDMKSCLHVGMLDCTS